MHYHLSTLDTIQKMSLEVGRDIANDIPSSKRGVLLAYFELKQESPAIADKPARRESLPKIASIRRAYNVVADNTGLSSCVYLLLRPKSAKSREIH